MQLNMLGGIDNFSFNDAKRKRKVFERQRQLRRRTENHKFLNSLKTECQYCGYNKCKEALVFHHINPERKKFILSDAKLLKSSPERVKAEAKKCVILCMNCHTELHLHRI